MKYEQHYAGPDGWGPWVRPIRKGYKLCCCDCGLVHTVEFRMVGRRIEFRVRNNKRATAAVRRYMKR